MEISSVVSWEIDCDVESTGVLFIDAIKSAKKINELYLKLDTEKTTATCLNVNLYEDIFVVDLSDNTVHLEHDFVGGWIPDDTTGSVFYYQDKDDYIVIYNKEGKHVAGLTPNDNGEWASFHNRINSKDYTVPVDMRESYDAVGYCVEILSKHEGN